MNNQPPEKKPATDGRKALTANELRWLGEAADGDRDKDCTIVWVGDTLKVVERKEMKSGDEPSGIDVRTPWRGKGGMHGGISVQIIFGTDKPRQLPANVDAIFLTQSAVEKFVLPYYMRMQDPEWVQQTRDGLYAEDIVAAVHAYPSTTTGISRKVLQPLKKNPATGEVNILDAI